MVSFVSGKREICKISNFSTVSDPSDIGNQLPDEFHATFKKAGLEDLDRFIIDMKENKTDISFIS